MEMDNLNEYCCICINTYEYQYCKLSCCRQSIHNLCLIDWILSENNVLYKCPICRKQIDIKNSITIGTIIDHINNREEPISTDKFDLIVQKLYPNTHLYSILSDDIITRNIISVRLSNLNRTWLNMKILFVSIFIVLIFASILIYLLDIKK